MNPVDLRVCASLLCLLGTSGTAAAQDGFAWDYPDGLGVRYLLHDRIERVEFKKSAYPDEMRALFLPKSKSDWVRIKGTEIAWGMRLYEFRGADDEFGKFLQERDPRRTFREFRVDGNRIGSDAGEARYWEFVDTWRPFVEILDRPQPRGPFRYAVSPELGVRFLADKSMEYVDPFVGTDGDNCYARLHPAPRHWIRIDGLPGPVGWMLRLHVFPEMQRERSSSDRDATVASFREFVERADPRLKGYVREFALRDEPHDGNGSPYKFWRWIDRCEREKPGTTPCFHTMAAVHQVGDREVVLLGLCPSNRPDELPEPVAALEQMVRSLEPWDGKAKAPGFAFYNVAASCRVGDREVGLLVHLPIGAERKPDRKLYDAARRMVQSLEAKSEQKR